MILVEIDQHKGRRDGFGASQLTFRRRFRPSRSLKAQQLCERLVPRDVALQNLVESKDGHHGPRAARRPEFKRERVAIVAEILRPVLFSKNPDVVPWYVM